MIRVGFVITFTDNAWLGGMHYFRNLLAAVNSLPDRRIEPVILAGRRHDLHSLTDFPKVQIIPTQMLDRKSPEWFLRKVIQTITRRDRLLESLLREHNVAVLSHSGWIGRGSRPPAIGWIPDFQHLHLPEFFSPKEIRQRDAYFHQLCENCDLVLVSSEDAKADLLRFAPRHAHKAKVLRFATQPAKVVAVPGLTELQTRYGFHAPYFHVPNQFWAHKNHRVVIEALRFLKSQGRQPLVLATGQTKDLRDPHFFPSLMEYAQECGVQENFRVLGLVPYPDLVGLMKNAVAVINPSLFEGWSTTVEEAKALGKTVILSDIRVHREQAPARSIYFAPANSEALAQAMETAISTVRPADAVIEPDASTAVQMFGRAFENLALEAAGQGKV